MKKKKPVRIVPLAKPHQGKYPYLVEYIKQPSGERARSYFLTEKEARAFAERITAEQEREAAKMAVSTPGNDAPMQIRVFRQELPELERQLALMAHHFKFTGSCYFHSSIRILNFSESLDATPKNRGEAQLRVKRPLQDNGFLRCAFSLAISTFSGFPSARVLHFGFNARRPQETA